jgi:hypothetical protein
MLIENGRSRLPIMQQQQQQQWAQSVSQPAGGRALLLHLNEADIAVRCVAGAARRSRISQQLRQRL